jgi:hypothetical protein
MAELTIPEYEEQLQSRRQQLEEARKQAQAQQLTFTQRQLRGLPTLQRQKALQQFETSKSDVLTQIEEGFSEQAQLEQEFVPVKQQFQKFQKAQAEKNAFDLAKKLYFKGIPTYQARGSRAYKYLKDMYQQKFAVQQKFADDIAKFQKKYPGEKLIVDYDRLQVKGVESAGLGMSVDLPSYEAEIAKINRAAVGTGSMPSVLQPQTSGFDFQEYAKTATFLPSSPQQSFPERTLERFKRGATTIAKTAAAIPTKQTILPGVTRKSTLGEDVTLLKEGISYVGSTAERGYEDIFKTLGIETQRKVPEQTIEVPLQETIVGVPGQYTTATTITTPERIETTPIGYVPKAIGFAPEAITYLAAPEAALGADIVAAGQKGRDIDKLVNEALKDQYQLYKKEELPEGYEYYSKKEFDNLYKAEIKKQIENQIALEAGISGGLLLGGAAFTATRGLFKTRNVRSQVGTIPEKIKFLEVKQPKISRTGEVTYDSQFIIKSTPQAKYGTEVTTSFFKEGLGLPPKRGGLYFEVPNPEIITSLGPIKGEAPYFAARARLGLTGLGKPKPFAVGGTGSQVDLKTLETLKVPEFQLRELIRKTRTGGRPIKLGEAEKYLIGEENLILSNVKTYDFFAKPGKKTAQQQVVSIVTEQKTLPDGTRLLDVVAGGKDVTFPGTRRAGRVPVQEGKVIIKPPIYEEGVEFFKRTAGTGPKTPLDNTFAQQVQIEATKVPVKLFKKPIKSPFRTKAVTDTTPRTRVVAPSQFAGTGLYERTEEVGFTRVGTMPKTIGAVSSDLATKSLTKDLSKIKTISAFKVSQLGVTAPKVISTPTTRVFQAPRIKVGQITVPKLAIKLKTVPKLQTGFQPTPVVSKPRPPRPKPPRGGGFKFTLPTNQKKIKSKAKKVSKGIFVAEVRRRGQWIPVAKTPTLKLAKQKGVRRVRETLAASLRIRKGKKILPIGKETFEFRPGKKNPLILVEKRGQRLSARGEVTEILGSKKSKGRIKVI